MEQTITEPKQHKKKVQINALDQINQSLEGHYKREQFFTLKQAVEL